MGQGPFIASTGGVGEGVRIGEVLERVRVFRETNIQDALTQYA
jgi:hypothetical protein